MISPNSGKTIAATVESNTELCVWRNVSCKRDYYKDKGGNQKKTAPPTTATMTIMVGLLRLLVGGW